MKRKRHSAEQEIGKLREAEAMLASGAGMAQVVQQLGVSEATYNRWHPPTTKACGSAASLAK